ncbi:hypothetical protein NIES4071_82950 [Calothrix sp. NIES-4071]|nr:hypothetical protein NIES4071_82950 [Calothrix sp. NIES-4071]BAZ62564.1 hypothetical protein NIES4105_82880 [Calothrix sp. NIES-4105]
MVQTKKYANTSARMLQKDIEISSVTLDNKPNLVSECGIAAAQLLKDGCERILIVWDLYPAWREKKESPCRKEDRVAILESLAQAGVTSSQVYLVCIEEELEAWLLADGRAISSVLSKPTHPVKIKDTKNPERVRNPKKTLNKMFQENIGRPYVDRQHAKMIVEKLEDLNKLNRCPTFARFAEKLTEK